MDRRDRPDATIAPLPALGLVTLLAAGCGGSSLTADSYLRQLVDVVCERAHECRSTFPGTAQQFEQSFSTSVSMCKQRFSAIIQDPDRDAALDRGTLVFDGADGKACLSWARGLSCQELWTAQEPDACETVFQGTVAIGDACEISEECADEDAYCYDGVCEAF